jgi:hypothetical protein
MIRPGADADQVRRRDVTHEAYRLPRHAHTDLELGTDRHPLDVAAEQIGEKVVVLVAPVEAHLLAEETAADSKSEPIVAGRRGGWHVGGL